MGRSLARWLSTGFQLAQELIAVLPDEFRAPVRFGPTRCGVHGAGKTQQLAVNMVEAIGAIIQLTQRPAGIAGMVKRPAEANTGHPESRDTDRSERIKPIGVLDDGSLNRFRTQATRKRMGFDCVDDCCHLFRADATTREELAREGSRLAGRLAHRTATLRKLDEIVQPARRLNDERIYDSPVCTFGIHE